MSQHALRPTRRPFERITLSHQFLLRSALLLLVSMVLLGNWLASQIEGNAVNRATSITAVYVESILATYLHDSHGAEPLPEELHRTLDQIFMLGPLRRKVVNFKLWNGEGRILYSSDPRQTDLRFPVEGMLAKAYEGKVQAHLHEKNAASIHAPELGLQQRLLEVYVPVHDAAGDRVIAVAEFYHSTEKLGREIKTTQQRSWLVVALGTIVIYLLLHGLVRRANTTILDQQHALRSKLSQLRAALEENQRMQTRLSDAGARTTALNEELLHRIAADLHDGPAQDLAFCLMRFDEIAASCNSLQQGEAPALREALRTALDEIRNIATGLALPGIADLSVAETARRAVADGERLWKKTVATEIDPALGDAPLAVKITLYRLIQESLANSWRHAPDSVPHLRVSGDANQLEIVIDDSGAGFDVATVAALGRLGLAFMRERTRLLGGTFKIDSTPGGGTHISARIPLMQEHDTRD